MVAYDLQPESQNTCFKPQTKYGIVTEIESLKTDEPYLIEWSDGTISTHPIWEMDIMQIHANLIFDYNHSLT